MKGQDGRKMLKLMLKGNVIRQVEATESVAGKNVYLSIDMEVQNI